MVNLKLAYCGLNCGTCPIYLATLETDKVKQRTMKKLIALQCNEIYGILLQPEEINDCDGCRATSGRIFSGCSNCTIRKCAREKGLEFCAYCNEYSMCNKLSDLFLQEPSAKTNLNEILKNLQDTESPQEN